MSRATELVSAELVYKPSFGGWGGMCSQWESSTGTFHLKISGRGRRPGGITLVKPAEDARTGQSTCQSQRQEHVPEGPSLLHSRVAGSSTCPLCKSPRLLVLAPLPASLLVQPTLHSGGDTPHQTKRGWWPRMFTATGPRGSIWPAGPETSFQGRRSVL